MQSIIGLNPDAITAVAGVPAFHPGTVGGIDDPVDGRKEFIYAKAGGTIAGRGYVCSEVANFTFLQITSSNAGIGVRCAVAQAAMSNNQFGWFQIYGKGGVRVGASAAVYARLNTTGTAGQLDDDGTSGAEQIQGIVLQTVQGGAAGVNNSAIMSYPVSGPTL